MGDGLHQQVVLFGIDVDDAGVEHLVHAAFAVPDKARGVLDEEAPLEHINGRVDVEHRRRLLARGIVVVDDLLHMAGKRSYFIDFLMKKQFD